MTGDVSTLITRVLAHESDAVRELIDLVTPTIQVRVTRALWRHRTRGLTGRDPRQEVEDMTQEVLVVLLTDGARPLRAWDPARGMSLANFVGLVAEHVVTNIMISGRRSPWRDIPLADSEIERGLAPEDSPELRVAARDLLRKVTERLRSELSPRGLGLFHALMVEERSIEDIARTTDMTADALYAWRSRLVRMVRRVGKELSDAAGASDPSPSSGNPLHPGGSAR